MKQVLIVQRVLPHYRVGFFSGLRASLKKDGIDLKLVYGQGEKADIARSDAVTIPWATPIENKYFGRLVWQPALEQIKHADLIIVENANRLMLNWWLHLRKFLGLKPNRQKFAYWGHGKDFQTSSAWKNRIKNAYSMHTDWWFCYTQAGADILGQAGYPKSQVTIVQNAIDVKELKEQKSQINAEAIADLRKKIGFADAPTGIFCGGMYSEKRLEFLLEASLEIRKRISNFQLIFLGSGPDSRLVEEYAEAHPWIHYGGATFGQEKVLYYSIADIALMPGLVGLTILDSFALEVPLITAEYKFHSPEISYLRNQENGLISKNTILDFSQTVVDALQSETLAQLQEGCRKASSQYTIENMIQNYAEGIKGCLRTNA